MLYIKNQSNNYIKESIIIKVIIYLSLFTSLYSNDFRLDALIKEQKALISKYEIKIKIAKAKSLYERINLLSQTLNCFKNSRSKKDITNCKTDEQKEIMEIIKN